VREDSGGMYGAAERAAIVVVVVVGRAVGVEMVREDKLEEYCDGDAVKSRRCAL
jgi:hypothetical protein